MNAGNRFSGYLQYLKTQLPGAALPRIHRNEEPPLRSELFSAEQMEQHGKALARSHRLARGRAPDQLLPRLAANESALIGASRLLTTAVAENRRITPAGEWLLDNFYLIEEQIRTAKRHLPQDYSRELPRLENGLSGVSGLSASSAGRPRVYDIALEIISHGDARVDTLVLSRFIAAYQSVCPLKLGELWATPIMLRLALIENLRRVGVRVAAGRLERNVADSWADQIINTVENDPKNLILVIADMARSNPPLVGGFVAEFVRRLQGRGPALALPLTWIEQQLSESGLTIEQLIHSENQQQAADQVSISNSIGSLRLLGATDWRDFVETMSVVERTLLEDPAGAYGKMDFATRDRYRHATESIARKSALSEGEVARKAVELAQQAELRNDRSSPQNEVGEERTGAPARGAGVLHVGFYLVDKGLSELEDAVGFRVSFWQTLRRLVARCPLVVYLGAIGGLTAATSALLLAQAYSVLQMLADAHPLTTNVLLAVLVIAALLAASQLAVALVNWLSTLLVDPRELPRMDFSEGVPAQARTLVIVPTLLSSAPGIEELIEALEVRFLANRDDRLHFGLLTDFCDADRESLPEDEPLLQLAQTRIEELNRKYGGEGDQAWDDAFFLLHRPRRWNPQEAVWMGYERKRGKLGALNALLRADGQADAEALANEAFSLVVGDRAILTGIKYVITLDTDTQLPRDAARQLVGAMAHPLNQPVFDAAKQRVVAGYGILQPRVAISLAGTSRSHYASLYGGDAGIDPYTRAISDVYQDVFGEGSFIGKGIYDVDAFEQALDGRFPENLILSHDLLEGCYARSGLLSDVQLFEDYPARYAADVSRRHRWIRGDWQLFGWLRRYVPAGCGERQRQVNPLSPLSQWKLIDNLRRSLVPAALMTLLLLGWTLFPVAWPWTLSVIGIMLLPALLVTVVDLLHKPEDVLLEQHLAALGDSASRRLAQFVFELACLPYEAYFSVDAIVRTLWRTGIAHKRLLEWNPSSEPDRNSAWRSGLAGSWRSMWVGPASAAALAVYMTQLAPQVLAATWPLLVLWFASPLIAWWVSRPLARRVAALSSEQIFFLRALARRIWFFFENFVGPDDHWLPPDNYQEYRVAAVAHRTSPTNIGLALLANLSAYDFGYIGVGTLTERTANTLRTMHGLERYRRHFYNWYDTQTLQPLTPLYVSTVDSGNLAGHLLTLRAGLRALVDDSVFMPRLFNGLSDTLALFAGDAGTDAPAVAGPLADFWSEFESASAAPPATLIAAHRSFVRLAASADHLLSEQAALMADSEGVSSAVSHEPRDSGKAKDTATHAWALALSRQCRAAVDELVFLAPWLELPEPPAGLPAGEFSVAIPSLRALASLDHDLAPAIAERLAGTENASQATWLAEWQRAIEAGSQRARERLITIEDLARQCGEFADMDYDFLLDKSRHLLSIGYNVGEYRADASFYDLLASEARLACFVGIAQGQLPQESWFALGRLLTGTGGEPVLLSWSGSMFEYLMPLLIMPTYDNTLLDQTCRAAVARQIEYGAQRGVPWGMSESGYNTVDMHFNYQYRAFGVPGLGLKRGLAEDLVVAPYASVMALMVAPEEACRNLQRLAAEGFLGRFGFFEAVDYTPARQRRGQTKAIVLSFMAHHQGMSLLSLAYLLLDRPMQRRFESDRLFQAVMPLLQERVPKATALFAQTAQLSSVQSAPTAAEMPVRFFNRPDTPLPEVQLLSNGRYHVMLSNAGGGYSRWKDIAVTRWREDGVCDNWGSFCYVREVDGSPAAKAGAAARFWSSAYQPTLSQPLSYEAIFSEGRAEFRRRDAVANGSGVFEMHTEIVVSPEDDIEIRRMRINNRSRQRRQIEVTSYAEVVIAPAAADALHPAFSNLFVETELLPDRNAILCTRRPRSRSEQTPSMLHLMTVHGAPIDATSYETDRSRFIGRARSVADPLAMDAYGALSGSAGPVLDPIVAIRHRITLDPEQSATIDLVTGIGETRDVAVGLVEKYCDRHLADRVFDLAWTHSQVVLQQINASEAEAQLHARLAGSIIYANPSLRAAASVLIANRRGQSGLWGYAISGDLPIVLLQISNADNIDLVRQLVQAHAYWRLKGLAVDLVIWNEDHATYRQRLQEQIIGLIASGLEASVIDRPGGIFVRPAEQISLEDRVLFQSVARVVLSDNRGTLEEQFDARRVAEARPPKLVASRSRRPETTPADAVVSGDLLLFNGLGGFSADGREYVITLPPGQVTPAPWVNVLANPQFGTVISESGSAYTWSENAHEFRLSPWHNDPVSDASGEAIYLRDEETGHFWSPTPLPARAETTYVVRHGFGYSVFTTRVGGIFSELTVFVALDVPVKFSLLKVRNESGRPRRLSATGYVEWVLGDLRAKSAMHVTTEIDATSGALIARNPYSTEFSDRMAFFDNDDPARTVSGDRAEFIGRNGTLRDPAAMKRSRLSGKVGAGLDPCAALQTSFELADGQEREVVFRLGVGRNAEDAARYVQSVRGTGTARAALDAVNTHWSHTLGAVQVETPEPALDVLANGWLVYQAMACRVWARSGYYQSGGAFGFRDQLQDLMALVHAEPALVREHLLLSASRQFREGDVQHWWHPPSNRGVRTRCSDDYLWLPLAVARYVLCTGDRAVLDEPVHFLEGRPVPPEEESYYDLPGRSVDAASLYEHCQLAVRDGLRFGEHGLPLIGSGDWNDGMNLVGIAGKGESVWLGFFLCEVLRQFAELARQRTDDAFATLCADEERQLRQNIEQHAWDGEWYRRAYFDDGTPLGSAANLECRIDSISQSWSVLSGSGSGNTDRVANLARSRTAMQAVNAHLVRRDDALIQLLDPPFDKTELDPGYIRGYVPGVRENGGQYTHAAIWATMAFAALGQRELAWELLRLINPVNHARSPEAVAIYKVEPYVVAADVYAIGAHVGRGGWSWYTGSAGWMYRLIVESLIGLRLAGDTLHLAPCLPAEWPSLNIHYRYRATLYHIAITQTPTGKDEQSALSSVRVDGVEQADKVIHLVDDRAEHRVEVSVGALAARNGAVDS